MKRSYIVLCFVFSFTAGHTQSDWQSLEASDGLYRVALPAHYQQSKDTIPREFGTVMVYNFTAYELSDSILYNFMDMHYPRRVDLSEDHVLADSILQINLREIANQLDGKVVYQAELPMKHRALQARIRTSSQRIVRIKMHALHNRFLLQQVHGVSETVNQKKAENYFNGLRLYPDNYKRE
ncbi:MAG TPA: hypothetical protein VJ917_05535 [Saprospiraceae bacterium]|nr:hypothetical protein [Saprospiraceae bacterium]